jgi:hypothetical protein
MQGRPRACDAPPPRLALAACLLALAASSAQAQEPIAGAAEPVAPELGLTWQAPAGCPSRAAVEAQFARLLGGPTRLPSGKHIDASALVRSASPDQWTLELATVLDGAVGRRTLAGDSCASVTSAAALILALMIDPVAAERALLAPAPTPAPAPPPTARALGPEDLVFAPPPPPEPRVVHATVRAFGGGVFGLLPEPTLAGGVAVGARARRFGGELSFAATGQRRVNAAGGAGGDFRLLVLGARACAALGGRVVVWRACAGGELERLAATGIASPAASKSIWMGAGTAGLLLEAPLGERFALALDLGAALRVYHPEFCADATPCPENGVSVARVGTVSAIAALGLAVSL